MGSCASVSTGVSGGVGSKPRASAHKRTTLAAQCGSSNRARCRSNCSSSWSYCSTAATAAAAAAPAAAPTAAAAPPSAAAAARRPDVGQRRQTRPRQPPPALEPRVGLPRESGPLPHAEPAAFDRGAVGHPCHGAPVPPPQRLAVPPVRGLRAALPPPPALAAGGRAFTSVS
mmetsp:Transcript_78803/g.190867  ORF Transcript_78803/g.190867 Transcript_78803/m.190867 type:complete len:172 (+) Transcript_78803:673-1188(+)